MQKEIEKLLDELKKDKRQFYDLGTEYSMNNQRTVDLTHAEFTLVNWYYGLFGEQWRLITDILSYHPISRGRLRSKDSV